MFKFSVFGLIGGVGLCYLLFCVGSICLIQNGRQSKSINPGLCNGYGHEKIITKNKWPPNGHIGSYKISCSYLHHSTWLSLYQVWIISLEAWAYKRCSYVYFSLRRLWLRYVFGLEMCQMCTITLASHDFCESCLPGQHVFNSSRNGHEEPIKLLEKPIHCWWAKF